MFAGLVLVWLFGFGVLLRLVCGICVVSMFLFAVTLRLVSVCSVGLAHISAGCGFN